MHTEISIDFAVLYSFIIALARISGFLLLVPLPGLNAAPATARIVLGLALTVCCMPAWPTVQNGIEFGSLVLWVMTEFAFGFVIGVAISLLLETFQISAQIIGLQAGFSYASTVDPSTQADTAVLQTILQLLSGMLFFALNLDLHVLKLLTIGLNTPPMASPIAKAFNAEAMIRLGTTMFTTGVRLAMPVIGSLMLLDLAFALLSKVHAQLQLLSLSFGVKMLAGLILVAVTISTCGPLLKNAAAETLTTLARLLT